MVKRIIKIPAMRKDWFTCKKCGYENEIKDGKVI